MIARDVDRMIEMIEHVLVRALNVVRQEVQFESVVQCHQNVVELKLCLAIMSQFPNYHSRCSALMLWKLNVAIKIYISLQILFMDQISGMKHFHFISPYHFNVQAHFI